MSTQFINQKLKVTLAAKDNSDVPIDLTGRTIHWLTRDPSGNVDTDTSPTIPNNENGQVEKIYAVAVLDEAGDWSVKLLIDGDEVPSTKLVFHVYDTWEK